MNEIGFRRRPEAKILGIGKATSTPKKGTTISLEILDFIKIQISFEAKT